MLAYILIITEIIILVIALIFIILVLVAMYNAVFTHNAPFISIPRAVLSEIDNALALQADSILYDLGSGNGELLRYLAQRYPNATFTGLENAYYPYYISKILSKLQKIIGEKDTVTILRKNFFNHDLSNATHIYTYLFSEVMNDLLPKLERELKPGTRLVSVSFKFDNKQPIQTIELERSIYQLARHIYIYEF